MLFGKRKTEGTPEADHKEFLRQLIRSNRFNGLGGEESAVYGEILSYRVQHDYYEYFKEKTEDPVTWEQFANVMRKFPGWVEGCVAVLKYTLAQTSTGKYFNFQLDTVRLPPSLISDGSGGLLHAVKLFDDRQRHAIVNLFFLQAEIDYYFRIRDKRRRYTWDRYQRDLIRNRRMWRTIDMAFRDGFARLDFKPGWQAELPEIEAFKI